MDIDDRGTQRPSIPARDQSYFEVVSEHAAGLRDLIALIRERQKG